MAGIMTTGTVAAPAMSAHEQAALELSYRRFSKLRSLDLLGHTANGPGLCAMCQTVIELPTLTVANLARLTPALPPYAAPVEVVEKSWKVRRRARSPGANNNPNPRLHLYLYPRRWARTTRTKQWKT